MKKCQEQSNQRQESIKRQDYIHFQFHWILQNPLNSILICPLTREHHLRQQRRRLRVTIIERPSIKLLTRVIQALPLARNQLIKRRLQLLLMLRIIRIEVASEQITDVPTALGVAPGRSRVPVGRVGQLHLCESSPWTLPQLPGFLGDPSVD